MEGQLSSGTLSIAGLEEVLFGPRKPSVCLLVDPRYHPGEQSRFTLSSLFYRVFIFRSAQVFVFGTVLFFLPRGRGNLSVIWHVLLSQFWEVIQLF